MYRTKVEGSVFLDNTEFIANGQFPVSSKNAIEKAISTIKSKEKIRLEDLNIASNRLEVENINHEIRKLQLKVENIYRLATSNAKETVSNMTVEHNLKVIGSSSDWENWFIKKYGPSHFDNISIKYGDGVSLGFIKSEMNTNKTYQYKQIEINVIYRHIGDHILYEISSTIYNGKWNVVATIYDGRYRILAKNKKEEYFIVSAYGHNRPDMSRVKISMNTIVSENIDKEKVLQDYNLYRVKTELLKKQ